MVDLKAFGGMDGQGTPELHHRYMMEYIRQALQDPKHPTACSGVLNFAMEELRDYEEFTDEFWQDLYRFMTTNYTEDEFTEMFVSFSHCACEDDSFGLHLYYQVSKEGLNNDSGSNETASQFAKSMQHCFNTEEMVISMFRMVHEVLDRSNTLKVVKGISQSWPRRISDILPGNPDDLLRFFIRTYRFVHDPVVMLGTMNTLISLCGPLIHDSLIKYHATGLILLQSCRLKSLDLLLKSMKSGTLPNRSTCDNFYRLASAFAIYLKQICRKPLNAALLMDGGETKALQLCSIFIYLLNNLPNVMIEQESTVQMLCLFIAGVGRDLYRAFRMDAPGRLDNIPFHPLIVEQVRKRKNLFAAPSGQTRTPVEYIALAMLAGRTYHFCSNVACRLYFVHVGNEYKMCRGCQTVGYCSRECQASDWRANRYGHKHLCGIFRKILKERGGWKGWFSEYIITSRDATMDQGDTLMWDIKDLVVSMRNRRELDDEEYRYLAGWGERLYTKKVSGPNRMGQTFHPGYADYDSLLAPFINSTGLLQGPQPQYMQK
ncbi:hypothetical protein BJ165DRAFT_994262 [Panaeolus papilionaceus]|nr:hypothetical protein BJ165DRAFT_994262 [Panaeolus papilionaceus]